MTALQIRQKIVVRKIVLPNGLSALGFFAISESVNGLEVKLVGFKEILDFNEKVLAIVGSLKQVLGSALRAIFTGEETLNFGDLAFLTSQPTRAPSGSF